MPFQAILLVNQIACLYVYHNFPFVGNKKLAEKALIDSSSILAIFFASNFPLLEALASALGSSGGYIDKSLQKTTKLTLELFV